MLTVELVGARVKSGELVLSKLDKKVRLLACELAGQLLGITKSMVQKPRSLLEKNWEEALQEFGPKLFKVGSGLCKILEEGCTFQPPPSVDVPALRDQVFSRASEVRKALSPGETFDRTLVLDEIASVAGLTPAQLANLLFADFRQEHTLIEIPAWTAEELLSRWEEGRVRAVLLTATRIVYTVYTEQPSVLRKIFQSLKFHKLLFTAEQASEQSWRLVIDGPSTMFGCSPKVSMALSNAFPALAQARRWELFAELRWPKTHAAVAFRAHSSRVQSTCIETVHLEASPHQDLIDRIARSSSRVTAKASNRVFQVRGEGVCVADLELCFDDGLVVFVEILGFWSRDAVFRRLALANKGFSCPVVFVADAKLRVSAEIFDESQHPGSLYVYKRSVNVQALIDQARRCAEGFAYSSRSSAACLDELGHADSPSSSQDL